METVAKFYSLAIDFHLIVICLVLHLFHGSTNKVSQMRSTAAGAIWAKWLNTASKLQNQDKFFG